MLTCNQLALRRGTRLLFAEASFTIHPGWKVGVTGANGTGKSSLFALIRGELQPDAGECALPADLVIAHVAQETPALDRVALEFVLDGDRELRHVQTELTAAERLGDAHGLARLHERLLAIDGYAAHARAARLLAGLGFADSDLASPVQEFSGGWRMRLNLAQALMSRSDLLLLDEPTNHLDLDAVIWLQDWLREYPGTLLLISHDRDFLDQVSDHIVHMADQRVTLYNGNYSSFEERRAQQLAGQQAAFERQQREVAHMRAFVARFGAKATKAKQAQSRLKALERMERIAPAHVDSPFEFQFPEPDALPNPLLQLEHVRAGYGEQPVLEDVGLSLLPGDRLGLLGANGAGKSTLIRVLAGELDPVAGARCAPSGLRIGYFAQHQLEQLDPQATPLLHLQRLSPEAEEQRLRDFLGGFGFPGDAALAPVAPFSGGEKARLVLALLVWRRPNLLLLDEPTNHLDLDMRHALNVALQDFAGALVLVAHDRYLLRSVCDGFLLVGAGRVTPFDGTLEDYRDWLAARRRSSEPRGEGAGEHGATGWRDRRRVQAERRARLQPLRRRIAELDGILERLGEERARVQERLADPGIYADSRRGALQELLREQGLVERSLEAAEQEWLELSERLERTQSDS